MHIWFKNMAYGSPTETPSLVCRPDSSTRSDGWRQNDVVPILIGLSRYCGIKQRRCVRIGYRGDIGLARTGTELRLIRINIFILNIHITMLLSSLH